MPPRNLSPQYVPPPQADPYYGDYSGLAQQYLKNRTHPVFSVGQGIADVLGDVGEAYFEKKALEKAKTAEQKDYSDYAMAQRLAGTPNPTMTDQGIQSSQGPIGMNAGQMSDSGAAPYFQTAGNRQATGQEVYQNAMNALTGVNPKVAVNMAPNIREAAMQAQPAQPKYETVPGIGLVAIPPGGAPTIAVPEVKKPQVVGHSLMDESGHVIGTAPIDPQEAAKTAAEIKKLNAEADAATQKNHLLDDIPDGITGPAVLDRLKPTERAQVESIVNGDQAIPSGKANPTAQRVSGLVALVDPTYTAQRIKVKQDVSSGQTSANIKRLGTAIGHIDTLVDEMGKLNNFGGIGTPLNYVINPAAQRFGSAAVNNVNQSADAVASELEAAFRGSGSSITGIHEWRKNISPNLSPDQQAGIKENALELLDSRLDSIANQWNQVMPASQQRTGMDFLSPKQREVYAKLRGEQVNAPAQTGASGEWSIKKVGP